MQQQLISLEKFNTLYENSSYHLKLLKENIYKLKWYETQNPTHSFTILYTIKDELNIEKKKIPLNYDKILKLEQKLQQYMLKIQQITNEIETKKNDLKINISQEILWLSLTGDITSNIIINVDSLSFLIQEKLDILGETTQKSLLNLLFNDDLINSSNNSFPCIIYKCLCLDYNTKIFMDFYDDDFIIHMLNHLLQLNKYFYYNKNDINTKKLHMLLNSNFKKDSNISKHMKCKLFSNVIFLFYCFIFKKPIQKSFILD